MWNEDCPAWCTDHDTGTDEDHPEINRFLDQHHAKITIAPFKSVSIRQGTVPDSTISLYVAGFGGFRIREAEELSKLLSWLGHEDIAAAIKELAALVTDPADLAFT